MNDNDLAESRLSLAIERKEFELVYQPQLELKTGRIVGAEALMRWNTPKGMVMPGEFIPAAESTGMIQELGLWALQTASQDAKAWQSQYDASFKIAVNVSPLQFTPELPEQIATILEATDIPPETLELEITESVWMYLDEAIAITKKLSNIGVKLSVDDFGTGYSSLAYLKRLPIHTLKIDRAFVQNIAQDEADRAISKAIITIAKTLHLETIAEGVETEMQKVILQELGCDSFQGYLASRPISKKAFSLLLRQNGPPARLHKSYL